MIPRTRFLFHADEGAAASSLFDTAAEAGAEPAPEPAPAAADTAAVPAEPSSEPAAPAWAADQDAFNAAVDERASEVAQREIAQILEAYGGQQDVQQPDGQVDLSQLDLSDPEHLAYFIQQTNAQSQQQTLAQIQTMLEPVLTRSQAESQVENEARLSDAFADAIARQHVEWRAPESADAARQLATVLFVDEQSRFPMRTGGTDRRAAQSAIDKGVKLVASIESAAYEKGKAAYTNEMATLAGANRETGAAGTGSVETLPEADTEMAAVSRLYGEQTYT